MFERLGSLGFRFRFPIVAAWIAAAAASVMFAPSIVSEGSTDQASFLPPSVPSVIALRATEEAFPGSTSATSATITFSRDGGVTDGDRAYLGAVDGWLTGSDAPAAVAGAVASTESADSRPELAAMLRSEDGELELLVVNLDVALAGDEAAIVVTAIRDHLAATSPDGLAVHVTGAAAVSSDYLDAIARGTDSTTIVTVALVILILLLIYRAPLAAMVPLVTIGAAFLVARGTLGVLASLGWELSSLLDTFLVVLVFGVGTDYAIFLISRYREEVTRDPDWHHASRVTVTRIGAVIGASAATVIVGLGAMAFGDFTMITTTGPALAVAIFVTLVAGLTLTPALLGIFGHYLFWPRHLRAIPEREPGGFFARLAAAVSRRPGLVAVSVIVALAVPATFVPRMQTNFDILSELPADSDSRLGYEEVARHLGEGNLVQSVGLVDGGPGADLLAPASLARTRDLVLELTAMPGVATVTSLVTPAGDGVVPYGFRPSLQLAAIADGLEGDGAAPAEGMGTSALLDPDVEDGLVAARRYLEAVATGFPDVAARSELRAARSAIEDALEIIDRVAAQSVLATQLRTLAAAAVSPVSMGDDTSPTLMGDYLDELAVAYPEVAGLDAYADARVAAVSLEREATIAAALDLSAALDALAVHFDGRPDATLTPESLADTAAARELRREATAAFDALPVAFRDLAGVFTGRPDDILVPAGLVGDEGVAIDDAVAAFVSADRTATRFYLTTADDPYSIAAFDTVRAVQPRMADAASAHGTAAVAYLGGPTAQFADVQDVLEEDFGRVGVITVAGILLVLMLLLRSVVAPLYLVATVLLSYGSALGLSAWFFQEVLGHPGVSFYLPLIVFVLLVALGSDYNIFLMSRIREESAQRPIRDGIRVASGHTGAVITSAGLILAGTFGAMATAPLLVLFQTGVAVALGVLIDTFVVRSILVPAITTVFGDRAWWPSGLPFGRMSGWLPAPAATGSVTVAAPASSVPDGARRPSASRVAVVVLIVALVPAVLAGLLTWSMDDPGAGLGTLPAAVVDGDVAATMTAADGSSSELRLGEDLAAALRDDSATGTFAWVAADAGDAAAGLADGRFVAVLTVPDDFSTRVAAIRADRTGTAPRATLRLVTNDGTSEAIAAVARDVAAAIAAVTAQSITHGYVGDVLLAVTGAHADVVAALGEARAIAADTSGLAGAAAAVGALADTMVAGLDELAAGVADAGDGSEQLADATRELASGADGLATGTSRISGATRSAAGGAADLAAGAGGVAEGASGLAASTAGLPGQVHALSDGALGVVDGAADLATGTAGLAAALGSMAEGTTGFGDQVAALDQGAGELSEGAATLATGARQAASGAEGLAVGAGGLATAVDGYTSAVAGLAESCELLGGGPPLCAQLAAIAATNGDLTSAADGVAAGARGLAGATGEVATGADQVAAGASALADGTAPLAASAPALEAGIAQSATGAAALSGGAAMLAEGTESLAVGLGRLDAAMPALASGVSSLAAGASGIADGSAEMADGLRTLAAGSAGVADGAKALAAGAAALAEGTSDALDGAALLGEAIDQAASAARLVTVNVAGLAGQGDALSGDAGILAEDLESAAAVMPGYTDATRDGIAGLAASPVAVEAIGGGGAAPGGGLAPVFLAAALWAGALAIFLVLPARRRTPGARGTRGALAVLGGWALLGVVQAVLAVAVLLGLGIDVALVPALVLVAVFAGVTFAVLIEALVAVGGRRGWLVALLALGLQVAAAGAPWAAGAMPAPLAAIRPLLPMSWAIDGMATAIAGGGVSLPLAVAVLALWLAGAVAVLVLVVAGERRGGAAAPAPA